MTIQFRRLSRHEFSVSGQAVSGLVQILRRPGKVFVFGGKRPLYRPNALERKTYGRPFG